MQKPMSDESISLLQVIKTGGFEASLMTTFNSTLSFYEDVVLRKLIAAGSRYNVVLMDRAQCARAFATPSLRPRLAGASYTLAPIGAPGAFHPKLCILTGRKRSMLLVGSHNLTLSGFGFNREVTNWIEVKPDSPPDHRLALAHAWSLVQEWLRTQWRLPREISDAVLDLGRLLPADPPVNVSSPNIRLLGQSDGGPHLLDQLSGALVRNPQRIVVMGAFFDARLALVGELEARWPAADIRVVIEPATVKLGKSGTPMRSRFVDAAKMWPEVDRYLHAKAVLMDFGDEWVLVSGSANPSRPAWMGGPRANFEAMLLRAGLSTSDCQFGRDLLRAFEIAPMTEAELRSVPVIAVEGENDLDGAALPIAVAVSRSTDGTVMLPEEESRGYTTAVAYDAAGNGTRVTLVRLEDGSALIALGSEWLNVRWIELASTGTDRLKVLVHHAQSIGTAAARSDRSDLQDALAGLEFSGAHVDGLLKLIHKAIFDDEMEITVPAAAPPHRPGASATVERPPTLAQPGGGAPVPEALRQPGWRKSGRIVEVLDALLRRLRPPANPGDPQDRPDPVREEENVGNDDAAAEPEVPVPLDERAVEAIRRRIRRLAKRMALQLSVANKSQQKARAAIVQLVAVLSLVREFRRLRHMPQWRVMRGFVDDDTRIELLKASMQHIFGRENGFRPLLLDADGGEPEELNQVRALLTWLAWDTGCALAGPISPMIEPSEQRELATVYSYLFELLPRVAIDDAQIELLRASMELTQKATVEAAALAAKWREYHLYIGEELATAPDRTFEDRHPLQVGDLFRLPNTVPASLKVVVEVTAAHVTVTTLDGELSYRRALPASPPGNMARRAAQGNAA